jgi:hypothetical protein
MLSEMQITVGSKINRSTDMEQVLFGLACIMSDESTIVVHLQEALPRNTPGRFLSLTSTDLSPIVEEEDRSPFHCCSSANHLTHFPCSRSIASQYVSIDKYFIPSFAIR